MKQETDKKTVDNELQANLLTYVRANQSVSVSFEPDKTLRLPQ